MLGLMLALMTPFAGQTAPVDQRMPAEPSSEPVATPVEKPVCRSIARTGSNFSTRICRTKEQWRAIDAANHAGPDQASRNHPRH